MSIRNASCLCGGIKVEIRGDPSSSNLCHCSSCQKNTASVFGWFAIFEAKQITFTKSEPSLLRTYIDESPESGNVLTRSFCGKCGSTVSSQPLSNLDVLVIPVGIIDGDKTAFNPHSEFYCRGRAEWVPAIKGSKTFERMPPN
ncbi:glutathione-dependent formaldehyde-activating, GFA [Nemania sp. NC0429]|nr:glutathione-dependent formaldehyde-activating, GFA [Nemania sp. NC0429]